MNDLEKQAHNYRMWGLIVEQQIIVEAMKAENALRERQGLSQAYSEEAFVNVANNVCGLANGFTY